MTNVDQPAFPIKLASDFDYLGLTKREYFAAMAMQGLIIHDHSPVQNGEDAITIADICETAAIYADSLLRQLETTK